MKKKFTIYLDLEKDNDLINANNAEMRKVLLLKKQKYENLQEIKKELQKIIELL